MSSVSLSSAELPSDNDDEGNNKTDIFWIFIYND